MFNEISKKQKEELNQILFFENTKFNIQIGWFDIVKKHIIKISDFCKLNNLTPSFKQVKTKFGTLRFYHVDLTLNKQLNEMILELDKECEHTCEKCSSQNNVKNMIDNRLVVSLCEDCRTEDMQEFNY